jgi:hypothetical protein
MFTAEPVNLHKAPRTASASAFISACANERTMPVTVFMSRRHAYQARLGHRFAGRR